MSAVVKLAWKSLMNRKATAILTIMTVAISVVLLLGVERIRTQARIASLIQFQALTSLLVDALGK